MYKHYYTKFLKSLDGRLHFAAHSHHLWPDVSREAHLQYWDDSCRLIDDKWGYIFSEVIPKTQKHISSILNLDDPTQIALAPNTHELVARLFSVFAENEKPIKVLTTHNEFHSFNRQLKRLEEIGFAKVTRVQADDLAVDRDSFLVKVSSELKRGDYDLFFMSQVFYDSGLGLTSGEIHGLTDGVPEKTIICIDGYHAFAAIPVNLLRLKNKIFYTGGGYKYAQSGEGVCFMVVPPGNWKPTFTGWFADIDGLSKAKSSSVFYPTDGRAFLGSTQDPSGFYRFNAVWDKFNVDSVTIEKIHAHVLKLQNVFLAGITSTALAKFRLMSSDLAPIHGHFLSFDTGSAAECASFAEKLKAKGILIDYRGSRLRFGFGMYHDESDVMRVLEAMAK